MSWYTYELIEERRAIEQHLKQLYTEYIKECVEWNTLLWDSIGGLRNITLRW